MKKMSEEDARRRCQKKMSEEEVAEEEVRRRSCKGTEIVKLYARSEVLQAKASCN